MKVAGHAVDPAALDAAYRSAREVFALPDEAKGRYVRPELHGARGLVPFGREKAKDATVADLKEFWHVGPTGGDGPDNVWPTEVPAFETAMTALHASMEATAELLLEAVAEHLGLPRRHLADLVVGADSILRVLHYPPVGVEAPPGAVRAAAHEDINFITLLPAATDDGLQLRDRDGRWCRVDGRGGRARGRQRRPAQPLPQRPGPGHHPPGREPRRPDPRPVLDALLLPTPARGRAATAGQLLEPGEVVPDPITAGEFHARRMEEIRSRARP